MKRENGVSICFIIEGGAHRKRGRESQLHHLGDREKRKILSKPDSLSYTGERRGHARKEKKEGRGSLCWRSMH